MPNTPPASETECTESPETTAGQIAVLRAIAQHGTVRAAAAALDRPIGEVIVLLRDLQRQSGCRFLPQLVAWAAGQGWLAGLEFSEAPDR